MSKPKTATLLRIFRPTDRDIEFLKVKFQIHPIILHELKTVSARARVEHYDGYLFFVYYFPLYDSKFSSTLRVEIDFIVTRDTVIAVHNEKIEALDILGEITEESSLKLLYRLVQSLLEFQERQLRHVREKVESVSKELFKDREREVLERVSYLKRDISEYRIIVRLQQAILQSLLPRGMEFWNKNKDVEIYLNDLAGDHLRIVNQVENYREAIGDFEDTNNQLMSVKINTVMKTFTILSFLTFPFVLLAQLLGLSGIPIGSTPSLFWAVVVVFATGIIGLAFYFKRKGWF